MKRLFTVFILAVALSVATGCATTYQQSRSLGDEWGCWTGRRVDTDEIQVSFLANMWTSADTHRSYWDRCAKEACGCPGRPYKDTGCESSESYKVKYYWECLHDMCAEAPPGGYKGVVGNFAHQITGHVECLRKSK
jgi:hypothetical protein